MGRFFVGAKSQRRPTLEGQLAELMIPSLTLMVLAGIWGWMRAARRGGTRADRWQFAAAHGIPAFLLGLILMTIAAHLGYFD